MILVITDHKGLRGNITELLELSNFQVMELENTPQKLSDLPDVAPELIIYGTTQGKHDWNFTSFILRNPAIQKIPIIFLTHDKIENYESNSLGFRHAFLRLPFETDHLMKLVEKATSREHSHNGQEES